MARRLNRLVSLVLSAVLVLLSAGFDAQRAAAQTLSGRAVSASPVPQLGLGAVEAPAASFTAPAPSLSAPALSAPAALTPVPALAAVHAAPVALKPATPAAAIAEKLVAAAPALQALAKPQTGGSAASVAGRDLENVLTGERSARASGDASVAGVPSALSPVLSAPSTPDAPKASETPAAAPAPEAPAKKIASASSYKLHRRLLKAVFAMTGALFTMPQASGKLNDAIIASAADKSLVLSDFDDTLAGFNEVLPAQKVEAVRKIRAAGKHFAVVSDRSDTKRGTQLTVFESLESIPAAERAGMYVAANSGGKVYKYDAQGVPQLVHEAAGLTEAQTAAVKEAAEATKARLSEAGAVQHVGDGKNPAESYGPYSYAIMLKPGSSQESVKGVAKILNEELAKRGFEVEVMPRFAKSPENPPYATFSIITKADAAAYIAGALKIGAKDALVIGDAMFVPREAKKASWLTRLGEKLSGRPQVKLGNETDRNMTKNLPGVLALGVGKAMDPRTENGWALDGHGPDVTQKVLEAVASKNGWREGPMSGVALLGQTTPNMAGLHGHHRLLTHPNASYAQALKRAGEIAVQRGVSADSVRFVEATASTPVRDGAQWKYTFAVPGALIYVDFSNFFGGAQDFRARVYEGAAPSAGVEPVSMTAEQFSLAAGLSAEHALLALRDKLPGFGGSASVSLAARAAEDGNGAQMTYKFYDDHGSEGTVGANGAFARADKISEKAAKEAVKAEPEGLTHAVEPNDLYALALANMQSQAVKNRVSFDKIHLLSAVHEARTFNGAWIGDEWRFHFAVGDKTGGVEYMVPARRTMVTETMMDAFEPKLVGPVSAERMKQDVVPGYLFNKGVVLRPDEALRQAKGADRVSLLPRTEPESGDMDLWYSLQKGGDEILAMNARTGEVRRPAAAPAQPGGSALKSFLIWLGLAAGVAALYGAIAWAIGHAPAAVPEGLPENWQGPTPEEFFQGMGGFLGLGALAGTLTTGGAKIDAKARKAAVEAARGAGADPASLRLIQTSGTLPKLYGQDWNGYVFSYADAKGGLGQIKVDVSFEGGKRGWRATVLPPISRMDGAYLTMEGDAYARGVSVDAKAALKLMRKALPFFGRKVGYVLAMRREAGAKEAGDLWYMFRDENGLVGVVNARTGFATTPVSDEEIVNWAKSVASNKGGIYSSTEYNMAYYNSYENLKARGASDAQLALFKKLCDEAPVVGGRFNPWSGD